MTKPVAETSDAPLGTCDSPVATAERESDPWRFLRESAKTQDHMNVHGATIHALLQDYDKALSDLTRAQEQIAALSDSARVHSNILTGQIALTKAQAIHIAGLPADIEQQIAALQGRIGKLLMDLEFDDISTEEILKSPLVAELRSLTAPIAPEKEG